MRKTLFLVFAVMLIAVSTVWAGCRISGDTKTSPGTDAEGAEDAQASWMGKYQKAPTLEDLGIPQYPASEMDESMTMVVWDDKTKSEKFVFHADRCPITNVAAFFRDKLKGMLDLEEAAGEGQVTFKFKTAEGVPVMIFIVPQDPNQPEGPSDIEVYVNP